MSRIRLTRRRALELGAAAATTTALSPALAAGAPGPTTFSLDLGDELSRGAVAAGRRRTLAPRRAPHPFDLLGVDWGGGDVHVEVRARRGRGPWTPWTALRAPGDHGPDSGREGAPRASEPVWTDTADVVQVRYTGAPRRLRVRFVRAKPAATAARRAHARSARAAGARAAAGGAQPDIIPREAWGGDRYPPKQRPLVGDVQLGFVHHTATANVYGPEDSGAIVLGILRYHRDHNGWNDIGYNFLVDRYGQIFEGRYGGVEVAVVGAQAQGWNSHSTGVSCIGDFTSQPFPAAGTEAVARLLAWKLPLHLAPVEGEVVVTSLGGASNRYRAGARVRFQRISGHRDGCSTDCPGATLYRQLPALRTRTAALAVGATGLTLAARSTKLVTPAFLDLSGRLAFADGVPSAGRTLQLQYQTVPGAPWQPVGTAVVGPDGSWALALAVSAGGRIRAVLPNDGVHGELAAKAVRFTVVPKLTLRLRPRRVRRGRRVRVAGTVSQPGPTRLKLLFERKVRGRIYRRVRRRSVRVRSGRLLTRVRPRTRGTYRVTLKAPGTAIKRLLRVR